MSRLPVTPARADFDARAKLFTDKLLAAANWKHQFYGAAYSTRIAQAIKLAREACDEAEQLLADDMTPAPPDKPGVER